MSRSQDAARARDIIRRRQRQEEEQDRISESADPTSLSTPPSRQPIRSPSRSQRMPVRITVSDRTYGSEGTPQIYSVPTTETFGDESLVLRQVAVPTPNRTIKAPTVLHRPPPKESDDAPSIPISHAILFNASQGGAGSDVRRQLRSTNRVRRTWKGEFQNDRDKATVGVQTVNIAQRSAFERRPPLALELWQRIAEQGGASRRSSNIALRMSPSYQHLNLLHKLQSIQTIRQVQFSPSTSLAADLFVDWWECCSDLSMRSRKGVLRDGRYRSIDPVRATVAVLPHFPPILSNKKTRLPRRSDVGFANASPDEIRVKQKEISHETEWEEASPRLVVLVTSDDLGTAVQDNDAISSNGRSFCYEHLQFNGGGLEHMPFAGRELIQAKERNARQFGQPCCPHRLTPFLSPNKYSMLAPPLDAMYSPSKGWKPRPFHDRPAGMQYCLVSPQSITFGFDDAEPLVCSLALYTLPSTSTPAPGAGQQNGFGKMSEEFWFPAGDWTGKFTLDDVRREDGSIDSSLLSSWMNRKAKGIFSFDPLALNGGSPSLFVVLQVFRLAHGSCVPLFNPGRGPEKSRRDVCQDVNGTATRMFQKFGTQLQSPLCFGVTPLYHDKPEGEGTSNMVWPDGEFRHFILHRNPTTPESQESFVSRLAAMVLEKDKKSDQSNSFEKQIAISESSVSSTSESSKKKSVVSRLFKIAPKQSFSDEFLKLDSGEDDLAGECFGDCKLFVSSLESDFLQVMLAAPANLVTTEVRDDRLPRLLVDVSGDLAVLLDPSVLTQSPTVSSHLRKRSSLLRLPLSGEPAGYARHPEFREVHYLPARSEKHYDSDIGPSCRSLTNLLYLYPRLLRQTTNETHKLGGSLFTIRIQALQSQSSTDSESGQISSSSVTLNAFHNPASWAGPILLDQIFTKTLGPVAHGDDAVPELPMRDEVKLRLPPVLDGSYSLRFELYTVSSDSEPSLQLVADAVIPLSSSLSRDIGRVATIIPNGNHRLKLGGFQLQLETRLVSGIHVGDPSVATLLRDYPCDKSEGEGGPVGSSIDHENWVLDATPLCDASPGSVVCHFETLLHMHLSNLLNYEGSAAKEMRNSPAFIRDNMISFFEVCRKVKERFLGSGSGNRLDLLRAFIKKQIDLFDENYLMQSSVSDSHSSDRFEVEADSASEVHIESSGTQDENKFEGSEEMNHVGAVRIRSISEQLGYRSSRSAARPRAPFSRVAFGASKTDRMKIEAELQGQKGLLSHFFDDDDTIATTPTLQTLATNTHGGKGEESKPLHPLGNVGNASYASSDNSIVRSASAGSHANGASGHRPTGSAEFAQRVRTVAQVMLAPCVGPSLSSILSKSNSPPASSKMDVKQWGIAKQASHGLHSESSYKCLPDSEAEQDEAGSTFDTSAGYKTVATHRDRQDSPSLKFSVASRAGRDLPVRCGEYLYETIFLFWLSAWLDHVETCLLEPQNSSNESRAQLSTFPIPDQNRPSGSQPLIFSYFSNMDILLPICLKSIVLRFSMEVVPLYPTSMKVMVDESHAAVLEPFVEMLARGLLGQALAGLGSQESRDKALIRALSSSEVVLDFLVGLVNVLHPEIMHGLLQKFFKTLREGETEHLVGIGTTNIDFEWSEESLHRVRFSRQLRLRAVEVLSVLPSFLALNYPPRYPSLARTFQSRLPSWNEQYVDKRDSTGKQATPLASDSFERLPPSRWLAEILLSEALSICSLSCEAVVAEAIAHIEVSSSNVSKKVSVVPSSLKKRPGADLKRNDLLMLQSLAIHAISCVYELILRRHAMDLRFQTDSCRERIAGLFASVILEKSLASSRWLARMESTHKVRSMWLLCFVYILQEAPDCMIRDHVRTLCNPDNIQIHRFIRLLRLSSSTFQGFVDLPRHANFPSQIDQGLSPWLLQESFNSVVAATITVVDECSPLLVGIPDEHDKLMSGILDLLLHLLTTPQSSVTHLRAVGGALLALEKFGVQHFLETTGSSLQHWIRVILSLMNSTSLSVRSIAVDFVVSLLGSTFDSTGDIGFVSIVFVTVLPEVAAREIALCSVNGLISTSDDAARSLWPLRRSFADIEDSNPLDDDRVDPHLPPILATFCRACQAALDGVLIEILLRGESTTIVGAKVLRSVESDFVFNSDEESLFETATFFDPESSPMQRIRWLMTLSRLHQAKLQWVEAAEALTQCSNTIAAAMPHLKQAWRPSRYILWSDSRRSLWLETVGEDLGYPDRGNTQVMEFAEQFLEPNEFYGTSWQASATGKLRQPSVPSMSLLLGQVARDAVKFYQIEGMDELAQLRLESLLKSIMEIMEFHSSHVPAGSVARKRHMEGEASLRRVLASISGELSSVTEKVLEKFQCERVVDFSVSLGTPTTYKPGRFLVLQLSGKKPTRFQESTALPTFLDFETPCICRLPINSTEHMSTRELRDRFIRPFVTALTKECGSDSVVVVTEPSSDSIVDESKVYLHAYLLDTTPASFDGRNGVQSKSFFYRKLVKDRAAERSVLVEMKVAHDFPCPLSRQRAVLTTEIGFFATS